VGGPASVHVVIPARGGSKGIPRKNLAPVGGTSLLVRAINAVQSSCLGVSPVVTTDDEEIAAVAAAAGAIVVERPAHLASDEASSESAVLHALDRISAADEDIAVLVQCTSPFIAPCDLDDVVDAIRDGGDSAFLAVPFHRFIWRDDGAGGAVGANHDEHTRQRRQERPPEWLETGAAYAMRVGGLRAHSHRFFGRVVAVPSTAPAIEVDTPADLDSAHRLARELDNTRVEWPWPAVPELLILDFDGVLTDDRVWISEAGLESVVCSRSDGLGVDILREIVPIVVVSTETNAVVSQRCAKLRVPCVSGIGLDKTTAVENLLADRGLAADRVAYVANDVNDLGPFSIVGYPIAVADAHPRVLEAAKLVLSRPGGRGAIRELADAIAGAGQPRATSDR
jgi:YrbI family 3-deoxy-D-manno-octulosonate 8-phosphate phosphatase